MKTQKTDFRRNAKGMVLPLVISIAVILAILGIGLIQMGYGSQLMAVLSTSAISARSAADAGVADALYRMNEAFIYGTGPGPLPPDVVNKPLNNAIASYSYHVEGPINGGTPDEHWLIRSTGTSGREARTVYARTGIRNLFDYALIVTDKIVLHNGTMVDGYDSSIGYPSTGEFDLKIGTNSIVRPPAGGIDLGTGSTVKGDVLVGMGGDPAYVIREGGGGAITGLRYSLPEPFVFQQILPPSTYDATVSLVGSNLEIRAPAGYTFDNPYKVITSSINIAQSERMIIVGPVALRVTGDIDFGQGAELYVGDPEVPPTDPAFVPSMLDIYLDGNLHGRNAGGINNLSQIPGYFKLFGTGAPYQQWEIKNSRTFYGVYYGPNADIIIYADADVFGSVSGHSYDMKNSGNMHYDVRLADYGSYNIGFGIDRWWEQPGP